MVEALWMVAESRFFTPDEKSLIAEKLAARINKDGELQVKAADTRSQLENKEIAREKLMGLVSRSLIRPRKRKATKPTKESKEKRLDSKKKEGMKKEMRRKPSKRDL